MLIFDLDLKQDAFELLKNRDGWLKGINFLEKATSCACFSRVYDIFYLRAQSCIFAKSLFMPEAEALLLLTRENSEVYL